MIVRVIVIRPRYRLGKKDFRAFPQPVRISYLTFTTLLNIEKGYCF